MFTGLLIAAYGSYLLTGISPDVTRGEIVLWTCIRSAGVGLSMMSVMTGGISALPRDLTTSGSAINTVTQRVSAALGLAGLTALASTQQAQMAAGRAALLSQSAGDHLHVLQQYAIYQRTHLQVFADSLSNIFLITAATTALAAVIALSLRSGPQRHDPDDAPVMME